MLFFVFSGLNWFKRIYVTSSSWENKQDISYRGDHFFVAGASKFPLFFYSTGYILFFIYISFYIYLFISIDLYLQ